MFLSIDVGNTQTTIGLLERGEIRHHWRLKTDRNDTSDELHAHLREFLRLRALSLDVVNAAAVASVVPVLTAMWETALADALGEKPGIVRGSRDCCMPIAMPYPEQVGADRIANAVEARDLYGAPAIVVDFGTATNIDVVDTEGRYRGGCIAPGLMLSASALFSRAAKLASIPIEVPPSAIGDTTEHALQAGLVLGVAAQAEGLVARIKAQLADEAEQRVLDEARTAGQVRAPGEPATPDAETAERAEAARTAALACPVVATGGLSRIIGEATDLFDTVDLDLTLRGIWRIWQHHQE